MFNPADVSMCVRRVRHLLLTCDDLGLSKDNLLCDATLSLIQLLTNAGDDAQTVLQSVSCLLTNQLSS